jgi:hypothetical protein
MRRIVVGLAVVGLAVSLAMPAGASGPNLAVTPTTNLVNKERIHVVLRRAAVATSAWVAAECDSQFPAHGKDDCNTIRVADGGVSTVRFTKGRVRIGLVSAPQYDGTCGTSAADNNCTVEVMPLDLTTFAWDTADAVGVPISFTVPS